MLARPAPHKMQMDASDPIVVAGLFQTGNGIGRAARGTYAALQDLNVNCLAYDLSDTFGVRDLQSDIPLISELPNSRRGTLILHLNGPETLDGLYAMKNFRFRKWRTIGYWSWELASLPESWKPATRFLSEIWTLSEFCKNAIEASIDKPVRVVPPYLKSDDGVTRACEQSAEFSCLIMADAKSSFTRKNVLGSISAFQKAFLNELSCRLIVKLQNILTSDEVYETLKRQVASDARISLVTEKLTDNETWSLISSVDVVISAHRAEGFGLHLAEAMKLGKVVIATGWSGNMDFMNEMNSVPVPSTLIPVSDQQDIYSEYSNLVWAQPDLDFAAKKLAELFENTNMYNRLSEQAILDISEHCSADKYKAGLIGNN